MAPAAWGSVRAEEADGEANPTAPLCRVTKTHSRDETRSGAAPLSEFCTGCTAVIPLSCVECCIIMFLPREYSEILAVGASKGILSRE